MLFNFYGFSWQAKFLSCRKCIEKIWLCREDVVILQSDIFLMEMNKKTDVALVLSSGGARGLAHIGVIEELVEQGYHISSIAGCSMGALIGGIYAAQGLDAFRQWMQTITMRRMLELTDFSLSLNHLVKGERIIDAMKEVVPDVCIEDLPIPFCAVATDWENGCEVVFRKGKLFDAIRASISLPSFFNPVRRDGMILIDGGVINPLPLNRVTRHEGDLLVGVDVSGHDYQGQNRLQHALSVRRRQQSTLKDALLNKLRPSSLEFNYITLLSRTSSLMIRQNARLMTELMKPDLLIDIQMNRFGSFDYNQSERLIAIGRSKAREALENFNG